MELWWNMMEHDGINMNKYDGTMMEHMELWWNYDGTMMELWWNYDGHVLDIQGAETVQKFSRAFHDHEGLWLQLGFHFVWFKVWK